MSTQAAITQISQWVDNLDVNAARDPEALLLHRTALKLTEEVGEVTEALIGYLGANPRKGVTNGIDKVLDELLDVALTALGAYEHVDGHKGRSIEAFNRKVIAVYDRINSRHD